MHINFLIFRFATISQHHCKFIEFFVVEIANMYPLLLHLQRTIRFKLMMARFQYPTICTETSPNGVMLSVSEDTPLAYYVPLANRNWPGFNATSLFFSTSRSDRDIPVLTPPLNQVAEVTTCVDTDGNSLDVVWKQENFTGDSDYWYLRIEQVMLGKINITNLSEEDNTCRYMGITV